MNVGFIGCGYVGLVSAAGFSSLFHNVVCVDNDDSKINKLRDGQIPFHEPGLQDLVRENQNAGRLRFTSDLNSTVESSEVIFLAVGTPQSVDGSADLSHLTLAFNDVLNIVRRGKDKKLVVIKSTVPVGTGKRLDEIARCTTNLLRVANNPEFLREGSAVDDFLSPNRIVLGTSDTWSETMLMNLYAHYNTSIIYSMSQTSAELVKYTSNSMLAMRISFMNEIARICDASGADIKDVIDGVGSDSRIGSKYLSPGPGFGGSCFGKDLSALHYVSKSLGVESRLAKTTLEVNRDMQVLASNIVEDKLQGLHGKTVGVLGLAFKSDTDDVRDSSSIPIIKYLLSKGSFVLAHDPVAMDNFKNYSGIFNIEYVNDPNQILHQSDAVILVTDWEEYLSLDIDSVKDKLIVLDMRRFAEIFALNPNIDYIGFGATKL